MRYAPDDFKFFPYIKSFSLNEVVKSKSKRLTTTQIKIYGYIYSWVEAGYFCRVSITKISEYLTCATSTVEVGIKRLEALGWITVEHGQRPEGSMKNVCNIYSIRRKPKATEGLKKVEKATKETKPKKTPAEIKRDNIWLINKFMDQIGTNYHDKKMITNLLESNP